MNNTKHNEIFFHNKIKTILLKKTKDADKMKNLKTISIIPPLLMLCEKLASKVINKITRRTYNKKSIWISSRKCLWNSKGNSYDESKRKRL